MKVVYIYDVPEWALHYLGLLLEPYFAVRGHEFVLMGMDEYHAAPPKSDVVYFAYRGCRDPHFPYRKYAREVVCTIHDPVEISHFTDRFTWKSEPLYRLEVEQFDRVSVTSREMVSVFRDNFPRASLFHTPTFPHDAKAIRAAARVPAPREEGPAFFSATNASARAPMRAVLERLRSPGYYALDHRGRVSLRHLRSLGIRLNRKNIPLLEKLHDHIASRPGAAARFLHGRRTVRGRADYVEELAASDVYICTSFMEGGPLPVMEAVLAGLAVLTTPVGQVEEWVRHGENGFICRNYEEFRSRIDAYRASPRLLRSHRERSVEIADDKVFQVEPWLQFILGAGYFTTAAAPRLDLLRRRTESVR